MAHEHWSQDEDCLQGFQIAGTADFVLLVLAASQQRRDTPGTASWHVLIKVSSSSGKRRKGVGECVVGRGGGGCEL